MASASKKAKTMDMNKLPRLKIMWEDKESFDFTVRVGKEELKAHKAVLVSVSDHFKTVLNESTSDWIKLKGYKSQVVSKLIEMVYTDDKDIIKEDTSEMLDLAVYLQIPRIVEACADLLKEKINQTNCFDLLLKFRKYSLEEGIIKAKKYINYNWRILVKKIDMKKFPIETLLAVAENWNSSEHGLLELIQDWIKCDMKHRKKHVNDCMSQIRFCLFRADQLKSIKSTSMFKVTKGPWKDLVEAALEYHKLPIHQKVIHNSSQSRIRGDYNPVVFFTLEMEYHNYLPSWDDWDDMTVEQAPVMRDIRPVVVEVNNYMIISTVGPAGKRWFVFDPQTEKWDMISIMLSARRNFALVHHDNHLYGLGGDLGKAGGNAVCQSVEQYTFKNDKWQEFSEMSYAVKCHAACVLGDKIYISGGVVKQDLAGGELAGFVDTPRVECLDIHTGIWESKAPLLKPLKGHKMHIMKVAGQDMVLAIDPHLQIQSYDPSSNQWSHMKVPVNKKVREPEACKASIVMAKHNRIYFLNYGKPCKDYVSTDEDDIQEEDYKDFKKRMKRIEKRRYRKVLTCPLKGNKKVKPNPQRPYPLDKDDTFSLIWEVTGLDSIQEWKIRKYNTWNTSDYNPHPLDGYGYGCMLTIPHYPCAVDPDAYDEEDDSDDGYIHVRA